MRYIKVNIITEASGPLYPLFKGCGLVTVYKELSDVLLSLGIDVKLNSKEKCDLIHINSSGPIPVYLASKSKVPVIITAHSLPQEFKYLYNFGGMLEKAYERYLLNFYNKADVIIAPTDFTKETLRELGLNKPIEVISNGINTNKFKYSQNKRNEFRKEHSILNNEKVVYSVGTMLPRKGIDKFVAIAKKMDDYKFVWSGKDGLAFLHKKSFFGMNGINAPNNFVKTGYVDDVVAAHCAGDVFLFPSPFETQGLVALEAAACSRPLVVEDVPSFEWLGKSCFRAKTVDEYCAQIEKAMKRNIDIQNYSKALVKENNLIKTGKSMIEVYEHVLSGL